LLLLLDEIDKIILSYLGKNARIPSTEIRSNLQDMGYKITERAVRYRLQRLEKDNMILGYSAILNPKFVSEKINRTIILKFKFSHNIDALMTMIPTTSHIKTTSNDKVTEILGKVRQDLSQLYFTN
jgi:DNA-binding Lrp family transcriptional regulator